MTPIVREYEERMRVFFRDAYGLSTAIAHNLPKGKWHDMARVDIEHDVQKFTKHTQQEIAFAFTHAAPMGNGCYGPATNPLGVAPGRRCRCARLQRGLAMGLGQVVVLRCLLDGVHLRQGEVRRRSERASASASSLGVRSTTSASTSACTPKPSSRWTAP